MTTASQDVAGKFLAGAPESKFVLFFADDNSFWFFSAGSQVDAKAEYRSVNAQVESLVQLAAEANVDFWADGRHCRVIVLLQDRAV